MCPARPHSHSLCSNHYCSRRSPQDRTKLSKIEWKYIIIDEAQRMKERESKLSKDLDRFTSERRLLLTGECLCTERFLTMLCIDIA